MTRDGYPEEHELRYIEEYDLIKNSAVTLIEYVRDLWKYEDYFTAEEDGEGLPGEIYLPYKSGKPRAYPHRLCIQRLLNDSVWDIKYVSGRSCQDISERGATEAEARARMWLRLKRKGLLAT